MIGFQERQSYTAGMVTSIKISATVPPGYGIVEISRLGGSDSHLSFSCSFEIAVGMGGKAKGGVQAESNEERNTATGVVYEMNNSTRVISLSAMPLAVLWEKDQIARRRRKHTDGPISKHVSGHFFPSPAFACHCCLQRRIRLKSSPGIGVAGGQQVMTCQLGKLQRCQPQLPSVEAIA
jgi:hypothetical protein